MSTNGQPNGSQMREIAFPFGGIDEYRGYAHGQPEMSQGGLPKTQSSLNMRGVDPRSGRMRGGSRCGLSKYCSAAIILGSEVQLLEQIASMGADPVSGSGQVAAVIANGSTNGVRFISSAGSAFWTLDNFGATKFARNSCWNDDNLTEGHLYTLYQNTATTKWGLQKRTITFADTPTWTATEFGAASATSSNAFCGGVAAERYGTYVYAWVSNSGTSGSEIWRFNVVTGVSPDGAAWKSEAAGDIKSVMNFMDGSVIERSANLIAWHNNVLGILERDIGGPRTYIRLFNTSTGVQIARTVVGGNTNVQPVSLCVDQGGNFYASSGNSGSTHYITKVNSSGTVVLETTSSACLRLVWDSYNDRLVGITTGYDIGIVDKSSLTLSATYTPLSQNWFSVDVDAAGRIYCAYTSGTDMILSSLSSSGVINWTGTFANGSHRGFVVNKTDPTEGVSLLRRETKRIAITGGQAYHFNTDSSTAISNGSGFRSGRLPIFGAQNGFKLLFADRNVARYFDLETNTMATWTPTDGSLPLDDYGNRPELICTWRGRTVLSGVRFDAQNWFMSRAYDPLDFDYSPATTDAIQAVAGNNSDAGLVGDVVTALIPYSDDVLIFGGDHMIHMMTGDPADNGQVDRVSDECGIAYGRAFCRMPNGALLFFGSRGGVYMMAPGGKPERITKGSIDERLSDVDMSTNFVRMAWFDRLQGAFLFITPATAGTATHNFFWDARNDAWWIDQFAEDDHNPTSMMTIDGDSPDDRHLLLGCGDGFIRKVDVDATTDDGTNIVSNLFLGPFQNTQLNELLVSTASGSSNVTWSTHAGKDAQTAIAASAGATGTFVAGRNRSAWPKRFGHALYLKLASTGAWALEQMMGSFSEQGGNRWRKF